MCVRDESVWVGVCGRSELLVVFHVVLAGCIVSVYE